MISSGERCDEQGLACKVRLATRRAGGKSRPPCPPCAASAPRETLAYRRLEGSPGLRGRGDDDDPPSALAELSHEARPCPSDRLSRCCRMRRSRISHSSAR